MSLRPGLARHPVAFPDAVAPDSHTVASETTHENSQVSEMDQVLVHTG